MFGKHVGTLVGFPKVVLDLHTRQLIEELLAVLNKRRVSIIWTI